MKKFAYIFLCISIFILSGCANSLSNNKTELDPFITSVDENEDDNIYSLFEMEEAEDDIEEERDDDIIEMDSYEINMRRDLLSLKMAYPEFVSSFERGNNGEVYVVMKSGKKILYDDKKQKTYDQKLYNADLQDSMEILYPLEDISELMDYNYDPGRLRCYNFLKEIYGGSRQEIEKKLKGVNIGGKVCLINESNNAAASLNKAALEISQITQSRKLSAGIFPVNGTYNYRVIAGTNQLSPHAFGIAIDFKSDKRDYWKWATREQGQERLNSYPREVVKILEDNNFIWGGKWAHFDILHFEYRPELTIKARYHVEDFEMGGPWYYGFPSEDDTVKSYIEEIDKI